MFDKWTTIVCAVFDSLKSKFARVICSKIRLLVPLDVVRFIKAIRIGLGAICSM